jgi:hypothetical protein
MRDDDEGFGLTDCVEMGGRRKGAENEEWLTLSWMSILILKFTVCG